MATADATAVNKAAGSGIKTMVNEVEAKAAGTKKTKLVKVGQHYIDILLEERAVNPVRSYPAWSPERIAMCFKDEPAYRDEILSSYAKCAPIYKKEKERDDEILRQYDAQGFAYMEMSDDDN